MNSSAKNFALPVYAAFLFIALASGPTVFANDAEGLSEEDMKAISQSQSLLNSPKDRAEFIKGDKEAQKADAQVDSLVGGNAKLKNSVYDASASIFESIAVSADGDADKMNAILEDAAKNPEAFFNSLPESEKAKIRGIASKINSGSKP